MSHAWTPGNRVQLLENGEAFFPRVLAAIDAAEPVSVGSSHIRFVARDNASHPTDIEQESIAAIRAATDEVLIANAYVLPGYRLLHELHRAAGRGVRVVLISQGAPDMPIVADAARRLYPYVPGGGVRVYAYCQRLLHGKRALVDDAVDSGLEQPRSVEPVVEPGGQRADPRPRVQRDRARAHVPPSRRIATRPSSPSCPRARPCSRCRACWCSMPCGTFRRGPGFAAGAHPAGRGVTQPEQDRAR